MNNMVIIGGDRRQKELFRILTERGFLCKYIKSEEDLKEKNSINREDAVILPVPVTKDRETVYSSDITEGIKICDVLSRTDSTNIVFGGGICELTERLIRERNADFFDYLRNEELIVYNAYLTGLGALKLLLDSTECDISSKKVLITGFGRVGRFTAQALLKAGCNVYVSARSKVQLINAECCGCKIVDFSKKTEHICMFDYIFNTVPYNIFNFEDVVNMKGKYYELASAPFGVRREYFSEKEGSYVSAGSLPGKYFPVSAAERLADLTVEYIKTRNGGD